GGFDFRRTGVGESHHSPRRKAHDGTREWLAFRAKSATRLDSLHRDCIILPLSKEGWPMRRMAGTAIFAFVACCAPGCGTIGNIVGPQIPLCGLPDHWTVYGGVKTDLMLAQITADRSAWLFSFGDDTALDRVTRAASWIFPFGLDLPLSAVADTVTL